MTFLDGFTLGAATGILGCLIATLLAIREPAEPPASASDSDTEGLPRLEFRGAEGWVMRFPQD